LVIRTPDKAAAIIENGQADFVGRGLLADPDWVQKVVHIAADLTIAATPRRPAADSLASFLAPHCTRLFSIGDSVKVGNIMDAVHDGFHAAMRLIDCIQ
jgi:hypothetical protein